MKVKFDKKLKKYHITFDKKTVVSEKKEIYKKLSEKYPITLIYDTEVDGRAEAQREYDVSRFIEFLNEISAEYNISTREIQTSKRVFGIPTMTKIKNIHSTISSAIPLNALNAKLIDFVIEHEIKISFIDESNEEQEFYDSAIFVKIFSTYDLSSL